MTQSQIIGAMETGISSAVWQAGPSVALGFSLQGQRNIMTEAKVYEKLTIEAMFKV